MFIIVFTMILIVATMLYIVFAKIGNVLKLLKYVWGNCYIISLFLVPTFFREACAPAVVTGDSGTEDADAYSGDLWE